MEGAAGLIAGAEAIDLGEFDFRYSTRKLTDQERTAELAGKMTTRLSYRPLTGRVA